MKSSKPQKHIPISPIVRSKPGSASALARLALPEAARATIRRFSARVHETDRESDAAGARRLIFVGKDAGARAWATAQAIAAERGVEAFRVNLDHVVSRYIGETEKNLARLFTVAGSQHWILFFDEADALFGKRTAVGDAHDRYANQEVSYILTLLETFKGIAVIATHVPLSTARAKRWHRATVLGIP